MITNITPTLLFFLGLLLPISICQNTRAIPQFILDHSPMIFLYSEENYYPGDIANYIPKFQLCLPSKNYNFVPNLEKELVKIGIDIPEEICLEDKLKMSGLKKDYKAIFVRKDLEKGILKFASINETEMVTNDNNADNEVLTFNIPSKALFMTRHSFNPKTPFFQGIKPTNMGRAPRTPATLIVRYHHKDSNKEVKKHAMITNYNANEIPDDVDLRDIEFIDAYWGLFYPFNEGAYVMGTGPWGNHLGDWEHIMVRFKPNFDSKDIEKNDLAQSVFVNNNYNDNDNEPPFYACQIWLSAHSGGFAYDFTKISKYDSNVSPRPSKPLIFSAKGTHANYASVGQHAHDVPFFFSALSDFTDRGLLWDVGSNYYGYSFDSFDDDDYGRYIDFIPSGERENELGTDWLNYRGRWGNAKLDKSHPLQKNGYVQWRYIDGPTGPIGKNLERERICERDYVANNYIYWNWFHLGSKCHIRRTIKKGAGLDAERGEFVGDNCGCLLYRIKPMWIRRFLELLTWRGLLCYIMEFFTG